MFSMPVNGGIPTTSEENTYDDPGELEVPSELTSITTLSTLLETQTQVLRQMLEKQDAVVASIMSLHKVMSHIDHRQSASDVSRQPIPEVTASSSNAWNPLLTSTMENTIVPAVDRWRSSLDTLLIFIALFSAIVTSFYIQATNGLTPDAGLRTNELLVNLTDVIVLLGRSNASPLSLPPPKPFEPDAVNVRTNLYWSVSLVLSVSIASLAVACRSYLTMLTRSYQISAHKKLTDLYSRWETAEQRLGPMIETLPQLLIVSVILFLVGLLDTLISGWLALSPRSTPVLAAGLISTALVALTGLIILWTFVDGCLHPMISPFQSTLSRAFDSKVVKSPRKTSTGLVLRDCDVFHVTLQATHDDVSVDRATSALWSVAQIEPEAPDIRSRTKDTLLYLLSPESSYRSNITAAIVLYKIICVLGGTGDPTFFDGEATIALLVSLKDAAHRYPAVSSEASDSYTLWNSPFTEAMAALLHRDSIRNELLRANSTLLLLLADFSHFQRDGLDYLPLQLQITQYAMGILSSQLAQHSLSAGSSVQGSTSDVVLDESCDSVMRSLARLFSHYPSTCPSWYRQFIASILLDREHPHVVKAFVRWFAKHRGDTFILTAIDVTTQHLGRKLDLGFPISPRNIMLHVDAFSMPDDHYSCMSSCITLTRALADLVRTSRKVTDFTPIGATYIGRWIHEEQCDLLCWLSTTIIRLLAIIRESLERLDASFSGVDREELRLRLDLTHEDPEAPQPAFYVSTVKHRNEVKDKLLEAFWAVDVEPLAKVSRDGNIPV